MSNVRFTVFYAVVFLAFYLGGTAAGPAAGVLIGAAVHVAGLVLLDLIDGRFRAADGQAARMFALRQRAGLLAAACTAGLTLVATALFGPALWAYLAGVGGGLWLGEWLGDRLGWSGASRDAEGEARVVALAVVCCAVGEGDDAVTAEMRAAADRELRRVAGLTLAPLGFESDADITRAMGIVRDVIGNANGDLATLLAALAPTPQAVALAETAVLRVVYAARSVPAARLRWLEAFYRTAGSLAGGLWAYYDRERTTQGDRERWLAELGLAAGATEEDVKRAYRSFAAKYHPDRTQGAPDHLRDLGDAKMRAVNEAYEALTSGGGAARPLTFRGLGGEPLVPSEEVADVCTCWLCEKANRLPRSAGRDNVRCDECYALLGQTART